MVRYLVLSDIHANDVALEAVLRHARLRQWDQVIFLGDAVGYYTNPERTVQLLIELDPGYRVLGNHDAQLLELAAGNTVADHEERSVVREVLQRHLDELSDESLAFLRSFRDRVVEGSWEATHGALRRPWEYLSTVAQAQANAPLLERDLCFVGHTHVPKLFANVSGPDGELWRTMSFRAERSTYRLPPLARAFFNPGSVGQPRDGLPLASYAVFDAETRVLELHRVEFDLLAVQRQVRDRGYPEMLGSRLAVGK